MPPIAAQFGPSETPAQRLSFPCLLTCFQDRPAEEERPAVELDGDNLSTMFFFQLVPQLPPVPPKTPIGNSLYIDVPRLSRSCWPVPLADSALSANRPPDEARWHCRDKVVAKLKTHTTPPSITRCSACASLAMISPFALVTTIPSQGRRRCGNWKPCLPELAPANLGDRWSA